MRVNCREQIANPAEPVNGQDERRKCAAIPHSRSITRPRHSKKKHHPIRMVFLYFSRSAQQNRRGSNSLPGIPRMAEPFAGALPLPLDLTRFALVEAASSSLPAAHSKKNTPSCRMGYSFCDCPQVLLSVNQCLLSCFSGDVVAPSSKSVTT